MEDYFFELNEEEKQDKMLILIIYDIVDNKQRVKFAKFLQGYGIRVQKSCFEAKLRKDKYEKLLREIPQFCTGVDSVRVYKIIGKSQVKSWGIDIKNEDEDILII